MLVGYTPVTHREAYREVSHLQTGSREAYREVSHLGIYTT